MRKSIWGKLTGSVIKLLFPVILLLVLALVAGTFWLVNRAAEPPRAAYIVTPERLTQFTQNGAQFTEETWSNADGTAARGWLVRGAAGSPAVVLLHRYGTDRSWLLNLGMKMNQAANFTVLIPDLRGHGESPKVAETAFGGCEADDLAGAISFLKTLKADGGANIVGAKIGVYGVEMGAVAALLGAGNQPDVAALALDSVPASPGDILQTSVASRASFASALVAPLAGQAAPLYFQVRGCYKNAPVCAAAQSLANRKILLLAGVDAAAWQASTTGLAACFSNPANVQKRLDLQPSGYNLIKTATPEQQETYNQIIIEFFRQALTAS